MNGQVRFGFHYLFLSFLLVVLHAGCFTARTLERAAPHNCKYEKVTRVTRAALSADALFIEFQAVSSNRRQQRSQVLRIPMNDSSWLHDKRGKPVAVSESVPSDTQVHDIADWFLLPADAIPADARELEIFAVETNNLGDLPEKVHAVPNNIQVFSVRYTISNSSAAWADPLIAVMSRPKPDKWRTALIIANIHGGCEQEKGWYALTPLALVGDTALLPFYMIVSLFGQLVGIEF